MTEYLKRKELLGCEPVDVLCRIVKLNPSIISVNLWQYTYKPLEHDEKGTSIWVRCTTGHEDFQENLKIAIDNVPDRLQVAVGSKVVIASRETAHIPMMDFNLPKNTISLKSILERVKYLEFPSGWILETGVSYHYYGTTLLSESEWLDFMGRSLLTSVVRSRKDIDIVEMADSRYIGHSLRRRCNTLRLTTRDDKEFRPVVVASI